MSTGVIQHITTTPQVNARAPYGKWRVYSPENTIRFYALRLHEEGATKSNP